MVLLHSLNQKYNKYLHSVKIQKSIQRRCLSKRHKFKKYQKIGRQTLLITGYFTITDLCSIIAISLLQPTVQFYFCLLISSHDAISKGQVQLRSVYKKIKKP